MSATNQGGTHRRIGHKKSRNGCVRCKARHVKCDEQAPCRNCVRHDLECSLVTGAGTHAVSSPAASSAPPSHGLHTPASRGPNRSASPSTASYHASPAGHHQPQQPLPPLPPKHTPAPSRPSTLAGGNGYPDVLCNDEPAAIYSPHWMQSVRLFHHYCQHTAFYMSRNAATTDLWLKRVPDVACSHEFLMHGLLACSALHYARTHPAQSQEHTLISTHYQTLALQHFTNRLNEISEDNVEAFFLLSTFIFMIAIANISDPIARQNNSSKPNDLAQSFVLLQGLKGILDVDAAKKLGSHDGPLAAMLHRREQVLRSISTRTTNFTRRLDRLISLARELDSSIFFDVVNPQTACILALESLRHTYHGCMETQNNTTNPPTPVTPVTPAGLPSMSAHLDRPQNHYSPASVGDRGSSYRGEQDEAENLAEQGQRFTWLWPLTLTQVFIQLVSNSNHMALIIVAHYAALARPFEGPFWVTKGWAQSILAIVENNLSPDKHKWIAWPRRCILEEIHVDDLPDDD